MRQQQTGRQQWKAVALALAALSTACFAQGEQTASTPGTADAAPLPAPTPELAPASGKPGSSPPALPSLPVQPSARHPTPTMAYVALGDSLTAGVQAAGLTAANQYSAYPSVVARLTDIPFGIPATQQGCPAPMGGGLSSGACQRVSQDIRGSNFAVPGAKVADLTARVAADTQDSLTRQLYRLVLGPRQTQVQAAIKSHPAYLTLWIGANDAMLAVTQGDPALVTPPETFEREYRKLLQALKPAGAKTLLLTVPDVTRLPLMTPGPVLHEKGVADESCAGSSNRVSLNVFLLGKEVSCGAPYALTPAETAQIQATVQSYNRSIHRLAREFGHDVLDIEPVMQQLDMHPATDETSPHPFGRDISADGVHPSDNGQRQIAYAVLRFVNEHWGVELPPAAQQELAQQE